MRMLTDRKIAKTKKAHRCLWCNEMIDAGSPSQYQCWIYEGDFTNGHFHQECFEALKDSDFGYGDEWLCYDQQRGKTYEESHN